MTTLPTLTPCPKPDCRAPITHWHDGAGDLFACIPALNGEPCWHNDPCYAPRATAPLHLPDRETLAPVVLPNRAALAGWLLGPLTTFKRSGTPGGEFQIADEVIRFLTKYTHHWVPVEPGTLIKEGTRYRRETLNGSSYERIAASDFLSSDGGYSIDPRTVPAEPEDPRLAVVVEWSNEPAADTREDAARDLLARLDAMGGDPR